MYPHHFNNQNRMEYYSYNSISNLSKSDRRQWNKSNKEFSMDYADADVRETERMAENQKRYDDYLLNLALNNQITKLLNKKDEKEEKLEKLEGGFNCYVNGAHKKNERYTPKHTTAKSTGSDKAHRPKSRITPRSNLFDNIREFQYLTNKERTNSAQTIRKKWENESFTIKTNDGYEIKINAPNAIRPKFPKPPENKQQDVMKKEEKRKKKKNNASTESNYSDDFESESEIEENLFDQQIEEEIEEDEVIKNDGKKLMQTVKFSDSDSNDESKSIGKQSSYQISLSKSEKNKKMSINLTSSDIKMLRKSISNLNLSTTRDSLNFKQNEFKNNFESTDEESEVEGEVEKTILSKFEFSSSRHNSEKSENENSDCDEVNEEEIFEDKNKKYMGANNNKAVKQTSHVCDLLIEKVSDLKENELKQLVEFLQKIYKKPRNPRK